MSDALKIAVAGCGPAGLAAALLLRRAGHHVEIFDQFSAPRSVGSGLILQPTGLGVLAELGVSNEIINLGARIERLYGRVLPSNRVVLDVRYRALGTDWCAVAVHRAALFNTLHQAVVKEGIAVNTQIKVAGVYRGDGKISLVTTDEQRVGKFDLIVDALGANSVLAKNIASRTVLAYGALWVNVPFADDGVFPSNALEQRYSLAKQMAGVLPIGIQSAKGHRQAAFFWSMKRSDVSTWQKLGLKHWKDNVERLWPQTAPLLESVIDQEQLNFAQYDHFTAAIPYSAQLVHIGDSSHATSPQLGQGANMALLDALALTHAIKNNSDLQRALIDYARMRRWHVKLFQWASAAFTPFYQSDSRMLPMLRDWIAAPASRLPLANALVARLVAGMTTPPLRGVKFSPLKLAGY